MAQYTRNLVPDRVVWLQDDVVHSRFYWLSAGNQPPREREKVIARRQGQKIEIESSDRPNFAVLLRDDMLDLDAEVTIAMGDRVLFQGRAPRTIANLAKTLNDRGDPLAMFSAQIDVQLTP